MTTPEALQARAKALSLYGLLQHWPEINTQSWVADVISWEETCRAQRSLERRVRTAKIGRFKPLCDFDWTWPTQCDQATIADLMTLDFVRQAHNVVLIGPNGVGKTTLARNIAHHALLAGHTVLFTSAGQLLGELSALDSDSALRRRLRAYAAFDLLCIDLCGVGSYVE